MYMDTVGQAFIDDLKIVPGTTPDVGTNVLSNGSFENGWPGAWQVGEAYRGSEVVEGPAHGGTHCLRLKNVVAGATGGSGIVQSFPVTAGQPYTLSFWYPIPPRPAAPIPWRRR